jgi:hypothetical protein
VAPVVSRADPKVGEFPNQLEANGPYTKPAQRLMGVHRRLDVSRMPSQAIDVRY